MIFLVAITDTLEVVTTVAGSVDVTVSYNDIPTATYQPVPGRSDSSIITATITTAVAAPAASTIRQVKFISISNKGTTAQVITVQINANGTRRVIGPPLVTLQSGEAWTYEDAQGVSVFDPFARPKLAGSTSGTTAANIAATANPVVTGGVDSGGYVRYILADTLGTQIVQLAPTNPGQQSVNDLLWQMLATMKAQTFFLSQLTAVARGYPDAQPGDEADAMIGEFSNPNNLFVNMNNQ